jgi:L-tryptophan--pyruvate aminotransferase
VYESRWAILKDFDLYQKVSNHVFLGTGGVSHDAQLRATQLMRSIIKSYAATTPGGRQGIFHFGHEVLGSRWSKMEAIFRNSSRFTLQELKPEYCNFFGKVSAPSPGI